MAYGDKARLARMLGIAPTIFSDYLSARKDAPAYRAKEIGQILQCDYFLFAKHAKKLTKSEQSQLAGQRMAAYRKWAGE